MNRIKVLLLPQNARNTNGGGILRYCRELTKLFIKDKNVEIRLIENLPYYHKLWGAVYDKQELKRIIEDSNCDIVHVNGFATLGVHQAIRMAKQLGKKVIYTPHWHPFWSLKHKILGRLFFQLMIRNLVKKEVDITITFNNEDTNFFSRINTNVYKIPHWIRTSKHQTECKRDPNKILLVGGRLNETNKGIEHIFHLPEGKYDIHLVGQGEVPYRRDITIHSNISDDELDSMYRQASLVVVPSRYESFSYVTLEALSSGTPVVISDRVRIGDYLTGCSLCRIFKFHDYTDFTQAVSKQIGNLSSPNSFLSTFSPQVAKDKYLKCYADMVSSD